jgi:cell division protein ZapA
MASDVSPVAIHILDKEYVIACPEDEREGLFAAASYLNKKMKEIRDSGKVVGADRVAVMAALNIAHDLLKTRNESESYNDNLGKRIRALQNKIDSALHDSRQMDL